MTIRWIVCFALTGALWADVVEQGPKDSPPSGLLAGVSRVDIAPPVGIAQMNWGSQTHVQAIGVDLAGMKATALVLSDGRQKFAMVDVDRLMVKGLEDVLVRAGLLDQLVDLVQAGDFLRSTGQEPPGRRGAPILRYQFGCRF